MKSHGKMPRSTGGSPDTGSDNPVPNGGKTRPLTTPANPVPNKVPGSPMECGSLDVGGDGGLGKMPRSMSGGRQYIPRRK
jgi:hypothetical protein